jgi:lysophospholipase L1-like esterase
MRRFWIVAIVGLFTSGAMGEGQMPLSDANILHFGGLQNCRMRFEKEKKGHVAFIGGSITQMNGYRPMLMKILQGRFPGTEFTFTDAGISSTCSTTGAFRLQDHVLSKGPVDLFFVEFAVNDDQDAAHASRECLRGMEGVVRHTRMHNPNADIVITFFVNPHMLGIWKDGKDPIPAGAHAKVAKHYGVSVNNLGKELADQEKAGKFSWQQFGGIHPGEAGNRLCANIIGRLMDIEWKGKPVAAKTKAYPMPEPLDKKSYYRGRLLDPARVKLPDNATYETPNWKELKGSCRAKFKNEKLICLDKSGTELKVEFEGTAIGAYVLAGPDAGTVETTVDGGNSAKVNLYHRYSGGLHYPRTVMFATDLEEGSHVLKLRVSEESSSKLQGHAIRILNFVAN